MTTPSSQTPPSAFEPPRRFPTPAALADHLDDLHFQHHGPLAAIKLASYAADAMRVFHQLHMHTLASPDLGATLRGACPTWCNPGSTADPASLIAEVLEHSAQSLQTLFDQMMDTVEQLHHWEPIGPMPSQACGA